MADQVIIRGNKGYKFVVLKADNGETVVFADDDPVYGLHVWLIRAWIRQSGVGVRCLGGGFIAIDRQIKTITIWGSSGDFGCEPDRQQTARMIRTAFPDFSVTSE
ncbi:MAG TPA: hypothetical protein VJJ02_02640 [Candidatus Paceibacterota bacterium]